MGSILFLEKWEKVIFLHFVNSNVVVAFSNMPLQKYCRNSCSQDFLQTANIKELSLQNIVLHLDLFKGYRRGEWEYQHFR